MTPDPHSPPERSDDEIRAMVMRQLRRARSVGDTFPGEVEHERERAA